MSLMILSFLLQQWPAYCSSHLDGMGGKCPYSCCFRVLLSGFVQNSMQHCCVIITNDAILILHFEYDVTDTQIKSCDGLVHI